MDSLITTDRAYIVKDDSFDLVSGSPEKSNLNVSAINHWASLLRTAFPNATIYAHTAGISHFATLARRVSSNVSGILYDYEPYYEREFSANFTQTVAEFENATQIAHARGLESIGYPTGQPILNPQYQNDSWNYSTLAGAVDHLVIQSQNYCHRGISTFETAVGDVLGEFPSSSVSGPPTLQITIGNNHTLTPNEVKAWSAYRCAHFLVSQGLRSLYLWWSPGANSYVVKFLNDIGRGSVTG